MREPLHHVVPAVPTAGFTLPAERFSRSQPNPALARRPALPSIVLQCCAAPLHCTRRRHTPGRGSTRAPPRLKFMLLDVNVSPGSCQKQKIGSHARCGPGATALPRSPPLLLTSRPVGAIGGGGGGNIRASGELSLGLRPRADSGALAPLQRRSLAWSCDGAPAAQSS